MKRSLFITIGLLIAMFIVACGNNTNTGSPYGGGNSGSTPTSSGNGSSNVVQTASATVNGKSEMVLTNAQGMTLYYRTSDAGTSVCSGGCAQVWPPLLFTGSGAPATSASLPGQLTASTDTNGQQVEYNGHPLYTYSGDTAPGQMNGEGFGGIWFVVPTDLAPSTGATATPSSGGYGSYP